MKRLCTLIVALGLLSVSACSGSKPVVVMETSLGTITIELNESRAPITVKNFLQYVDEKFYDGTVFHRVIPDFMIQGGGFTKDLVEKKTRNNIKNESSNGLTNDRGTLAMARTPDPDSASAQFFINLRDNKALNRKGPKDDEIGYAVFGKVIDGMDVVDKIADVTTDTAIVELLRGGKVPSKDVPVEPVIIKSIRRVDKK